MIPPTLPTRSKTVGSSVPFETELATASAASFGQPARVWLERCECGVIAVLLVLVTALHVRFVTSVGGLWRDETNSVSLATLPSVAEIWRFLDYDSFPVLFFGVLRGWTTLFGADNDIALRALGLITGLGILAALWANARSFGIKWPVLSFALIGLNPMLIRYGDSTRAYGLGIVLILLTLRSFWRLVDSPSTAPSKRILSAGVLALLSVQCLYYNSVLLFAIAAGAMAVAFRQRAWRSIGIILGIGMLAAASLLPYLPMIRRMREWTFMVAYPADYSWLWQRAGEVMGSPRPVLVWIWTALFAACVALTALALVRFRRREGSAPAKGSQQEIPAAVLFGGVTLVVGVAGLCVVPQRPELLHPALVLHHARGVRRLRHGGRRRRLVFRAQLSGPLACLERRPARRRLPAPGCRYRAGLARITNASHQRGSDRREVENSDERRRRYHRAPLGMCDYPLPLLSRTSRPSSLCRRSRIIAFIVTTSF